MKIRFAVIGLLLLMTSTLASPTTGLSGPILPPLVLEGFGLPGLVRDLSLQSHVPIRIEDYVKYEDERTSTITFGGGSPAQALDRILQENPGHRIVTMPSGDLEVSNEDQPGPGGVVLSYSGIARGSREDVWNSLYMQPELTQWLLRNKCEREDVRSGKEWRGATKSITIAPGLITLRDLLDESAA